MRPGSKKLLVVLAICTCASTHAAAQERRLMPADCLPSWREELDWIYEDPRERLHVIRVTVRDGRVQGIYIGTLWD
jgi:hypothetical protein